MTDTEKKQPTKKDAEKIEEARAAQNDAQPEIAPNPPRVDDKDTVHVSAGFDKDGKAK